MNRRIALRTLVKALKAYESNWTRQAFPGLPIEHAMLCAWGEYQATLSRKAWRALLDSIAKWRGFYCAHTTPDAVDEHEAMLVNAWDRCGAMPYPRQHERDCHWWNNSTNRPMTRLEKKRERRWQRQVQREAARELDAGWFSCTHEDCDRGIGFCEAAQAFFNSDLHPRGKCRPFQTCRRCSGLADNAWGTD